MRKKKGRKIYISNGGNVINIFLNEKKNIMKVIQMTMVW
jgi:hypothetical protein